MIAMDSKRIPWPFPPRVICPSLWFINTGRASHEVNSTMVLRSHGQIDVGASWVPGDIERYREVILMGYRIKPCAEVKLVPNTSSKVGWVGGILRTSCSNGVQESATVLTTSDPWWAWVPIQTCAFKLSPPMNAGALKLELKHTI